jgi:hypothetical protein
MWPCVLLRPGAMGVVAEVPLLKPSRAIVVHLRSLDKDQVCVARKGRM